MKFKFAPSLPAQLEPSTFYMIAQGEQLLEIHVTNADASAVRTVTGPAIQLKFDRYDLAVAPTTGVLDVAVAQTFKLTNNTNSIKNISVVNAPANRSMAIVLQIAGNVGTVIFPGTFDFGKETPDFTKADTSFTIYWNGSTYSVTQNR